MSHQTVFGYENLTVTESERDLHHTHIVTFIPFGLFPKTVAVTSTCVQIPPSAYSYIFFKTKHLYQLTNACFSF